MYLYIHMIHTYIYIYRPPDTVSAPKGVFAVPWAATDANATTGDMACRGVLRALDDGDCQAASGWGWQGERGGVGDTNCPSASAGKTAKVFLSYTEGGLLPQPPLDAQAWLGGGDAAALYTLVKEGRVEEQILFWDRLRGGAGAAGVVRAGHRAQGMGLRGGSGKAETGGQGVGGREGSGKEEIGFVAGQRAKDTIMGMVNILKSNFSTAFIVQIPQGTHF
jgi:hypothetical protein